MDIQNLKTLTVHSSYDVLCGEGLLCHTGKLLRKSFKDSFKTFIVSDSTVFGIYGKALEDSLTEEGISYGKALFPAGEASKSIATLSDILNGMAYSGISRSDIVIALGGGVVGDIAGLASALYERGIRCVQIPTTLLAAVDSSVGGKTAVNLSAGKNLCGVFHRPSLVICDVSALRTLPHEYILDGMAEMIKYGIIYDGELFSSLSRGVPEYREFPELIFRCIEIKAGIVEQDEHDTGIRMILNYGHTFAHAIEAISGYSITHGHAVSIGSVMAARLALDLSVCSRETLDAIAAAIEASGLPCKSEFSASELFGYMLTDKKRRGDFIDIILPTAIGECTVKRFSISELKSLMEGLDR